MNEVEMTWWLENIWTQRARQGSNQRFLLVLDSFSAHKTDAIKCRFHGKNTDLAVIPGGLTSRLNKPFKAKVISFYQNFQKFSII
jgi:hypothetical protein